MWLVKSEGQTTAAELRPSGGDILAVLSWWSDLSGLGEYEDGELWIDTGSPLTDAIKKTECLELCLWSFRCNVSRVAGATRRCR